MDTPDIAGRHFARQIGILGKIFKVAPTEGGALDVQAGAQQNVDALGRGLRAQMLADLLTQRRVPGVGNGGGGGIAGGGHRAVQAKLIPLALLFADAVGAVGEGHVGDAQTLHTSGLPKVFA